MGAVAILSIVSAAGVIYLNIIAVVDSCAQQRIFFFGEDATDLSAGDRYPPFGQLLQDQRLGDLSVVRISPALIQYANMLRPR